jgi:hypothetical protein
MLIRLHHAPTESLTMATIPQWLASCCGQLWSDGGSGRWQRAISGKMTIRHVCSTARVLRTNIIFPRADAVRWARAGALIDPDRGLHYCPGLWPCLLLMFVGDGYYSLVIVWLLTSPCGALATAGQRATSTRSRVDLFFVVFSDAYPAVCISLWIAL